MRRLAVSACLCAILGGGCGGGDDEAPSRSSEEGRPVTVAAGGKVVVLGREYYFRPAEIEVEGPGRLTLALRNAGALAHNAKLFRDGREVGGSPIFPGGRTESGRVKVEPGRYEMVCTVGDHAELGMVGAVVVR
jgi:plastocyanin